MKVSKKMIEAYELVCSSDYSYSVFERNGNSKVRSLFPALKKLISAGYIEVINNQLVVKKNLEV